MKLKEIPPYVYHGIKLAFKSAKDLNTRNSATEIPVVVSLTTIPSRIRKVHLTIRSILSQEEQPKKIVLWLHERFEGKIPRSLKKIEGDLFEIRFSQHDFSHLKLIESLLAFPSEAIVTIDDDLMYPPDFLKLLYKSHLQYPNDIISNQVREITFDANGAPLPYIEWKHQIKQPENPKFIMPLGVFGVLYPAQSLDVRVTNVPLLESHAPKADDLWFKAMSLLKGTTSRVAPFQTKNPILILGTQKIALKRTNKHQDFNRVQWIRLMEHFNISSEE